MNSQGVLVRFVAEVPSVARSVSSHQGSCFEDNCECEWIDIVLRTELTGKSAQRRKRLMFYGFGQGHQRDVESAIWAFAQQGTRNAVIKLVNGARVVA